MVVLTVERFSGLANGGGGIIFCCCFLVLLFIVEDGVAVDGLTLLGVDVLDASNRPALLAVGVFDVAVMDVDFVCLFGVVVLHESKLILGGGGASLMGELTFCGFVVVVDVAFGVDGVAFVLFKVVVFEESKLILGGGGALLGELALDVFVFNLLDGAGGGGDSVPPTVNFLLRCFEFFVFKLGDAVDLPAGSLISLRAFVCLFACSVFSFRGFCCSNFCFCSAVRVVSNTFCPNNIGSMESFGTRFFDISRL